MEEVLQGEIVGSTRIDCHKRADENSPCIQEQETIKSISKDILPSDSPKPSSSHICIIISLILFLLHDVFISSPKIYP
jgi:hypothetical protein